MFTGTRCPQSMQIIVMYNETTSGFEVLMAHNNLNGNMSPWAWCCSLCIPHYLCTSIYAKMHSNRQWSITWSFLPQICTALDTVLLKLHAKLTQGWALIIWSYIGSKVGSGSSFVSGCSFARLQYIHRLSLNHRVTGSATINKSVITSSSSEVPYACCTQ